MPAYKLHYFNLRGRAELARLILNQAGVEFEDIRFERAEWPALKASEYSIKCLDIRNKFIEMICYFV